MPAASHNHRLLAREHLAEAAALADEGREKECRASLMVAAAHAIGQLAADHRLAAPSVYGAMGTLRLRGALPFDARPLWSALGGANGPRPAGRSGSQPLDTAEAIRSVQVLVDLAAGVPSARLAPAIWRRWGSTDEEERDAAPPPPRASAWVRAAAADRARRRSRRALFVTAMVLCAVSLGGMGLAWSNAVEGSEYRPPKAELGLFNASS